MKYFLFLTIFFITFFQENNRPEIADQLIKRYEIKNGFEASVKISVDVPGITAPEKIVEISAQNGKQPKIKGEGIILMPKKGFIREFSDILSYPVHWILIDRTEDFEIYKLVSLDPKSDWITADIKVNLAEPRIDEINITTRDAGLFDIAHFYDTGRYPIRTVISFTTERFSLPLKFMGKSELKEMKDSTGVVQGKILLDFLKFDIY